MVTGAQALTDLNTAITNLATSQQNANAAITQALADIMNNNGSDPTKVEAAARTIQGIVDQQNAETQQILNAINPPAPAPTGDGSASGTSSSGASVQGSGTASEPAQPSSDVSGAGGSAAPTGQ